MLFIALQGHDLDLHGDLVKVRTFSNSSVLAPTTGVIFLYLLFMDGQTLAVLLRDQCFNYLATG